MITGIFFSFFFFFKVILQKLSSYFFRNLHPFLWVIFLKLILDDVCLGIGTVRSWFRSLLTDEAKLIHTCKRVLYKHFQGLNIGNYFKGYAAKSKRKIDGDYLKNIGNSTAAPGRKWYHAMLLSGGEDCKFLGLDIDGFEFIGSGCIDHCGTWDPFRKAVSVFLSTPGHAQPDGHSRLHLCPWKWTIERSFIFKTKF